MLSIDQHKIQRISIGIFSTTSIPAASSWIPQTCNSLIASSSPLDSRSANFGVYYVIPSFHPFPFLLNDQSLTLPSVDCQKPIQSLNLTGLTHWHDRRRYREILTLRAFSMRARGFFDCRVFLCPCSLPSTSQKLIHSFETMLSWHKPKIQCAVSPLVLNWSLAKRRATGVGNVGSSVKEKGTGVT